MKKYLLLGFAALVLVLATIFGPMLLDLYRLQKHVTAYEQASESELGAWPRLAEACTFCHGANGNSLHQGYPALAGQPAAYLISQLRRFASGQRSNPNMSPLAMTLSDAEIDLLAEYFARQSVAENRSIKPDPQMQDRGKKLVESGGCAACHGARLTGQGQFARLAGQGAEYLRKQLDEFAAGKRTDPTGTMNNLAAAASSEEREAMAVYLASLAVE
jgi:cytochrome c553